jgi:hypothetical protein
MSPIAPAKAAHLCSHILRGGLDKLVQHLPFLSAKIPCMNWRLHRRSWPRPFPSNVGSWLVDTPFGSFPEGGGSAPGTHRQRMIVYLPYPGWPSRSGMGFINVRSLWLPISSAKPGPTNKCLRRNGMTKPRRKRKA